MFYFCVTIFRNKLHILKKQTSFAATMCKSCKIFFSFFFLEIRKSNNNNFRSNNKKKSLKTCTEVSKESRYDLIIFYCTACTMNNISYAALLKKAARIMQWETFSRRKWEEEKENKRQWEFTIDLPRILKSACLIQGS